MPTACLPFCLTCSASGVRSEIVPPASETVPVTESLAPVIFSLMLSTFSFTESFARPLTSAL